MFFFSFCYNFPIYHFKKKYIFPFALPHTILREILYKFVLFSKVISFRSKLNIYFDVYLSMTALLKYLYLLKIFYNHQSPNSKINKKWWQILITLSLHTLKYFYFLNSEFLQMKIHKLIKRLMKTFSSIFNNGIDFIYCWWNQFWLKFLLI